MEKNHVLNHSVTQAYLMRNKTINDAIHGVISAVEKFWSYDEGWCPKAALVCSAMIAASAFQSLVVDAERAAS